MGPHDDPDVHAAPSLASARERQALWCALAAVLLWSTVATGFKLGLAHLAPLQLLFIGTVISWVLFAVTAAVRSTGVVHPADRGVVVGLGLINPFGYYVLLFEAYDRLPAQIAQPLNYTWAVVLAVLAVPLLHQPLSRRTFAGILTSYAGALILVSHNPLDPGTPLDSAGIALALASTVLWAVYWLINTRCRSDPVAVMFASFSVGLPAVACACWWGPGWPELSVPNLLFGTWVGLVEMGVTFLLWQRALRLTASAARIGQLIFVSPFLSFAIIAAVLGETIGVTSFAGLAVIVAGLLVTGTPASSRPTP